MAHDIRNQNAPQGSLQAGTAPGGPKTVSELAQELAAQRGLEQQGSVMAQFGQQQPRQTGNPVIDTLLTMINKGVSAVGDPLGAISGPAQAMIAPLGKISQQPQIRQEVGALLNVLAERAPELFKKVLQSPEELLTYLRPAGSLGPTTVGNLSRIPSREVAGKVIPAAAHAQITREAANKLPVTGHEILGHFLAGPRVAATSPRAAENFSMLADIVSTPGGSSSLNQTIRSLQKVRAAVGEGTKSMRVQTDAGIVDMPIKQVEEKLQRLIMDEALATLVEAQLSGNTNPLVPKLAEALGFSIGKGPQTAAKMSEAIKSVPAK